MIFLVTPPGKDIGPRSSRWGGTKNRSGILMPSIYLATAASLLKKHGVEARLIDTPALRLNGDSLLDLLKDSNAIVALESATVSIDYDAELARRIKDTINGLIVLLGAHVTALPEKTLRDYPWVDIVVMGEYEFTLLELYMAWEGRKDISGIKGIAWRKAEEIIINEPQKLVRFDEFPIPAYEDLPLKVYNDPITMHSPCIPILSSRGCPFRCKFCVAPQVLYGYTVRYRNPKLVTDEIELLIKRYDIKEVFFDDATFTLNRGHVFSICEEILSRGLKIDWSCFGRADLIDKELLSMMKRAGCYMIRFGIESLDDKLLRNMDKGLTVNDIVMAISLTKEMGFKVHATVMLGYPGETKETIKQTIEFVKNSNIDFAQFSLAIPYPGTAFYRDVSHMLTSKKWEDFDGTCKAILRYDTIDAKELENVLDRAYKEFYLRPKYILKRLVKLTSTRELKKNTIVLYYLIRSLLRI